MWYRCKQIGWGSVFVSQRALEEIFVNAGVFLNERDIEPKGTVNLSAPAHSSSARLPASLNFDPKIESISMLVREEKTRLIIRTNGSEQYERRKGSN